ncbi:MAG: type II toxin-antitoxin system VapC family toxin, partial [Spirochaetales bacterium]
MILFDTDICVEILRGNRSLASQRKGYNELVAVSFMTAAELYYGAYKSSNAARNRTAVEQFLITVDVIESDAQIVRRFGILKADLTDRGSTVADADLLIADRAISFAYSFDPPDRS